MICPYCNAEISDSMKFCENCGSALLVDAPQLNEQPAQSGGYNTAQPSYDPYTQAQGSGNQMGTPPVQPGVYAPAPTQTAQASTTPFVLAIVALVLSFLGLFPVSIILAIVALVMNSSQKKRGEFSTKQTPTTVMSVISLIVSALVLVFTIAMVGVFGAYVASEGVNTYNSKGASAVATSPRSQSSSASASGSASADANAPKGSEAAGASSGTLNALAGEWKLTGLVSNGNATSAEEIEAMQNYGLTVKLTLNEDGTAVLVLFGAELNGTWESPDNSTVLLTSQGATIPCTVSGNNLSMVEGSDELTFTKQ